MVTNESLSTLQLDVWILPMIDLISIGIPMNSSSFICGVLSSWSIGFQSAGSFDGVKIVVLGAIAAIADRVLRIRTVLPGWSCNMGMGMTWLFHILLVCFDCPFFWVGGFWSIHKDNRPFLGVFVNSECFRKSHFSIFAAATLKLHHLFQGYAVGKVDPLDQNVSKSLALQSPTEPIWTTSTLLWPRILCILDNLKIFGGSFAESFRENWPMKRIPAPARSLPTLPFFFQAFQSHETMVLLKRKLNRIPATWDQETFGNGMCKVSTKLQVPQFCVCSFMEKTVDVPATWRRYF